MEEGHVITCLARSCSYNSECECDAPSIQVGDDHPRCDTFTTAPMPQSDAEPLVGTCAITDCHFNRSSSCEAAGVTMTMHSQHADCGTYRL